MPAIEVGTRVVVRYRIEAPEPDGPRFTDALGILTGATPHAVTVTTRRGEVTIPRAAIAVVRPVPATPPAVEARRRQLRGD